MKRSEAAKYARWSAAAALTLAAITGAVYVKRGWQRMVEKRNAPPAPPMNVERQSTALTFSQREGKQTVFTVEASKSTDFRGENASLLEDVKITVFGKTGERHDILHTQSCEYSKEKGSILCSGPVQIDMLSAQEAESARGNAEAAAEKALHVETKGVMFDRATGLAKTDQPVMFRFPNGEGQAVGVEYRSDEGTLKLQRDVRVKLRPTIKQYRKSEGTLQEVEIRGSHLDFGRDNHLLELKGPATAETGDGRISAGQFQMVLDSDFRAKTLFAKPTGAPDSATDRPEVFFRGKGGQQKMSANLLTATFTPEGWVEKILASGRVQGTSDGAAQKGTWQAESAEATMWPKVNQPKELNLRGGVAVQTSASKGGDARELQTEALRMVFREGKGDGQSEMELAETLAPGSLLWKEDAAATGPQQTKLSADRLALKFGNSGQAQRLEATGNVQTEKQVAGKAAQTASSKTAWADLAAGGGWAQIQMEGAVRMKEGDRTASADHAIFLRAEQTATLTGHAVLKDATTQTIAPKFTLSQRTGDMFAEGGVKSTDLSTRGSTVNLAPAPANITAKRLQANSKSGRAVYSGNARLWQGDAVMEAETIELLRESRTLTAANGVRAVFPQYGSPSGVVKAAGARDALDPEPTARETKGKVLWNVSADRMTYWDNENRAHLEKDVVIQSTGSKIRAAIVDMYFTRAAANGNGPTGTRGTGVSGAQQISRAVATGGVVVEQGGRKATAERGEYTAAEGKFVMSGGTPTIFDAASGSTTGRQLTFFLADDTIIVDSENGSRTLTKHRVE